MPVTISEPSCLQRSASERMEDVERELEKIKRLPFIEDAWVDDCSHYGDVVYAFVSPTDEAERDFRKYAKKLLSTLNRIVKDKNNITGYRYHEILRKVYPDRWSKPYRESSMILIEFFVA